MQTDTLHELMQLIDSRTALIQVETVEEIRLLKIIGNAAELKGWDFYVWTISTGVHKHAEHPSYSSEQSLKASLGHIKDSGPVGIYALLDAAPHLIDPASLRLIKEITEDYPNKPKTLILLGRAFHLPEDLAHISARVTVDFPTHDRIREIYLEQAYRWLSEKHGRALFRSPDDETLFLQSLSGLPEEDVERIVINSIQIDGKIDLNDVESIVKFKKENIGKDGLFEFYPATTSLLEVGGIDGLKQWLDVRRSSFLSVDSDAALPAPKGVLLLGVQGCGKSIAAKAVANAWHVPLLRLDFGILYSKWLGETEENVRTALKQAEAMSPCVLWIDEIEKGITSDSGGSVDGGVSRRLLATILVWMAERSSRVFLVATANDVSQLPPELLRKGRFDEIFFIDLPSLSERHEIFEIHLIKRKLNPAKFDLARLVKHSEGFSGSEIEQAIVSGLYSASPNNKSFGTEQMVAELLSTKPLSAVMSEKVSALRDWAETHTRRANGSKTR